jgi:hypothetical protein
MLPDPEEQPYRAGLRTINANSDRREQQREDRAAAQAHDVARG